MKHCARLYSAFANPKVGCVAGEKRIAVQDKPNAASGGEGLYWKYESALKRLDYRLYSAVGAAGELFAIRTSLFEQMPPDTLLDDFILSLRIAMRGYKIAYSKEAYALESASLNMREEEKRKVRISAGGLQSVWRLRGLLNIFRYGILSFQYISHRVLRWDADAGRALRPPAPQPAPCLYRAYPLHGHPCPAISVLPAGILGV